MRKEIKKAVIFGSGYYPIGSLSLRYKMWAKGLIDNGVSTTLLIAFPGPLKENIFHTDEFVRFTLPPIQEKQKRNLLFIFTMIKGVLKSYLYLKKDNNISFVIMARSHYLMGSFVKRYCRKRNIPFFVDKGDENGKLFSEQKLSFFEKLASVNQILFDKYILPHVDVLFVVSSYLEKKYKEKYTGLRVRRSFPTYIDYEEYKKLQKINISKLDQKNMEVFDSKKTKVFYAGACNRTNGIKFFLDSAAILLNKKNLDFEIIFIFVYGDVEEIKKYCKTLGIENNVTYIDPVLPKYIPSIYQKVDILVLPEHGDVVANAGFPGKTGEYLASGKAIISTIFSDLELYLKNNENAMLAKIGDIKRYTDNLEKLIRNECLRMELGKNAINTALDKFDYKKGTRIYIDEV